MRLPVSLTTKGTGTLEFSEEMADFCYRKDVVAEAACTCLVCTTVFTQTPVAKPNLFSSSLKIHQKPT